MLLQLRFLSSFFHLCVDKRIFLCYNVSCSGSVCSSHKFHIGMSPSGKAQDFDSCIRWFEPSHPSQKKALAEASAFFNDVFRLRGT